MTEGVLERIEACLTCPPCSAKTDDGSKMVCIDVHETHLVTGCEDGRVIIWDLERRAVECELQPEHDHASAVTHVVWSHDGPYVMAVHTDGVLECWDVSEGRVLCKKEGFVGVRNLCLWQVHGKKEVARCLVASAEGLQSVSVMRTSEMCVVPFHEAAGLSEAWYMPDCSPPSDSAPGSIIDAGTSVSVFSNESYLAVYSRKMGKLEVYHACDASRVGEWLLKEGTTVSDVCFVSLEGASYAAVTCAHEYIVVLEIGETGTLDVACQFDFSSAEKKRRHTWLCSSFSPNGRCIYSGMVMDGEQYIVSWDRLNKRAENMLQGPGGTPVRMMCLPDPIQLFVLCDDGRVYIWCSIMSQRWSVFQPDFETLEHNREYVEAENEFDHNHTTSSTPDHGSLLYDIDDGDAPITVDSN